MICTRRLRRCHKQENGDHHIGQYTKISIQEEEYRRGGFVASPYDFYLQCEGYDVIVIKEGCIEEYFIRLVFSRNE